MNPSKSKLWLPGALIALASCTYGPTNGQVFSGAVLGKRVSFTGYANAAGAQIRVQVIRSATLSGASNGDWVDVFSTTASTRATIFHPASGDPLYAWSGGGVPVSSAAEAARWPEGGVTRFRVLQNGSVMRTFDDLDCPATHASNFSPRDVWEICRSHADGTISVVDRGTLVGGVETIPPATNPYLSRTGTPGRGAAYYARIGAEATFAQWRTNRGFRADGAPATGETIARYYNAGDLGLGREMHCKRNGSNVSCYVTNYGSVTDGLADETSALADLAARTNRVATVAMDYVSADPINTVRFYVYRHIDFATGAPCADTSNCLTTNIALDGQGPKSVPGLCIACHGGTFDDATADVRGAQFLPFDVDSFRFSSTITRESQAEPLRALNALVLATNPTPGIRTLVNGWYHGTPGVAFTSFDGTFVPDAWRTACNNTSSPAAPCKDGFTCSSPIGPGVCRDDPSLTPKSDPPEIALYRRVFAPYCRTCHIAQTRLPFADFASFRSVAAGPACGSKDMPHAELIRQKFWESGARAHLLGITGTFSACN